MTTQAIWSRSEVSFLRGCDAFADLSTAELTKLVRSADRVSVPARWPLIHQRTPGDACYILLAGRVGVFSGRDRVAVLGPGDLVGEVALRWGRLRSATVSSLEPVRMLRIAGEDLARLLTEIPELRRVIAAATAHGPRAEIS